MKAKPIKLIENTKPAEHECNWCGANVGDVHTPACPMGERYRQVQDMGGVPWGTQTDAA